MGERNVQRSGSSRPPLRRLARRQVVVISLACVVLLVATAAALAATGDLSQPPGPGGCISQTGAGTCIDGHALDSPGGVAVSPDGKSVFVGTGGSHAVVRLNRNPIAGEIGQPAGTAGCISETGAGPCIDGHAIGAGSVAVSPDGKNVYTTGSNAVARLNRNPTTGAISQPAGTAGCISDMGAEPCADGHGFNDPGGVAVSPDGKNVYVAGRSGVARFNRNTTTGAISQPAGAAGCIDDYAPSGCAPGHALYYPREVAVSPDGKSVYVTALGDVDCACGGSVVRLNRNTTTGAISQPAGSAGCVSESGFGPCADGHALYGPEGVAVSPDGKSVYVAALSSGDLVRFNRNTSTGAIIEPAGTAGCIGADVEFTDCAVGRGFVEASGVAVSPDGKNVYVASYRAVARLNRNTTTGAIGQPAGTAGCVRNTGAESCADGHALQIPVGVAVSPDGKSVYVTARDSDAVVRFNRAP